MIAPSGPFDRCLFWRAMGWLATHYRVRCAADILARSGFLAGSDARRRAELQGALDDPRVSAVIAARGGWGANRVTESIDFSPLTRYPKWLVGFSDVTALHVNAWHHGVVSLHAANLVSLGRSDARAREQWLRALQSPLHTRRLKGNPVVRGYCEGILVGGNLTVLVHCLAKGKLRLPERCILAIEDVTETSYRVDRLLDTLLNSALLGCLAGIVVGQFIDCDAGKFDVPVARVLQEHCRRLGVPTLADVEFGHGRENQPLLLGYRAVLDCFTGELVLGVA